MIKPIHLEDAEPIHAVIVQMYDYVKLEFAYKSPYKAYFGIILSDNDIDKIIEVLTEAKKERAESIVRQEELKKKIELNEISED